MSVVRLGRCCTVIVVAWQVIASLEYLVKEVVLSTHVPVVICEDNGERQRGNRFYRFVRRKQSDVPEVLE